jgi:hypothetical protein
MKKLLSIALLLSVLACSKEDDAENLPPSNFTIAASEESASTAKLTWTPSVDPEGGLINYTIYLADEVIVTTYKQTEYVFEGLKHTTSYSGKIVAVDSKGSKVSADFTFQTAESTDEALVAKYSFCGDVRDDSGFENHGVTTGNVKAAANRFNIEGCAYSFPGTASDYITVPSDVSLLVQSNEAFSISLWYQGHTSSDSDLEYLFVRENSMLEGIPTDFHLGLYDCNNPAFGGTVSPIAFAPINECSTTDNAWHHLVAVYDNGNWNLYVDNVLEGASEETFAIRVSTNNYSIGKHFKGKIDDVSYYKRALGEEEIDVLYNATE